MAWPAAAITPAPLAAANGGVMGALRPFYLNGVLLVVLFSAAAAIGGAVFLAVVLRQIDDSRSQAATSTVSANARSNEDIVDSSSDAPANWTPPDKATSAEPPAAHDELAADSIEEEVSPDSGRAGGWRQSNCSSRNRIHLTLTCKHGQTRICRNCRSCFEKTA